jgi:mannose-6-phosphate isomerase-like protein (cupin superfamily)
MHKKNLETNQQSFAVLLTDTTSQVAVMVLDPGDASGPKGNEHPKSEQVLFVISGEVWAEIGDEQDVLRKGDVVIVPKRKNHRFVNRSGQRAITLNIYAPPAY